MLQVWIAMVRNSKTRSVAKSVGNIPDSVNKCKSDIKCICWCSRAILTCLCGFKLFCRTGSQGLSWCCAQFWPLLDYYPPSIGRFRVGCGGGVRIRQSDSDFKRGVIIWQGVENRHNTGALHHWSATPYRVSYKTHAYEAGYVTTTFKCIIFQKSQHVKIVFNS